jgi:hypothetical protein
MATGTSRYDLVAIGLVTVLFVLAAVSVDLLGFGAVALLVWVLHVSTPRASTTIAPASTPTPGSTKPVADTPYRSVYSAEPAVFPDEVQARDVARREFESWVSDLPRAPKRSSDLIRSIELHSRHVARLITEIEARRVVECYEPAQSQLPTCAPPMTRQQVDSWNPPSDLPRASRFITSCWTCRATGVVGCTTCGASGRVECTSCNGLGKYYGYAANGARRRLNCKTCRGKGRVTCAECTRGKVACPTCRCAKKLAGWLEVRAEQRRDTEIIPEAPAQLAFAWSRPGVPAADEQFASDALTLDVITKRRPLTPDDLPPCVPATWRAEHARRLQPRMQPGERIQSQTFTFLAVPSASITYSLLDQQQTVVLDGFRMVPPPAGTAAGEPFVRRARQLGRLAIALTALPVAAAAAYLARGSYFTSGRAAGSVACLVVAAAISAALVYGAVWNASLGRRRARIWGLAAVVPIALAVLAAAIAEPRIGRANDFIAADRLSDAAIELRALGLPPTDDAWADLHLRSSLGASTCAQAVVLLHDIRAGLPQRDEAQAHADDLAIAETAAAIRAQQPDQANVALACSSTARRATPAAGTLRAEIADLATRRCINSKDWSCALERAAFATDPARLRSEILTAIHIQADLRAAAATTTLDLKRRIEEERAVLLLWQTYLIEPGSTTALPRPVVDLRTALSRDETALAAQERLARIRAQAEERRQEAMAERERKRAELAAERERRRQAAEEARERRASRGLLCNDGTLSPSCTCGGSHRGCCSWHGGVAGCAD